jgi:hypothetical protein
MIVFAELKYLIVEAHKVIDVVLTSLSSTCS